MRELMNLGKTPEEARNNPIKAALTSFWNEPIDMIAAGQGVAPDYRIEDGSVIMVREREPKTIQVIGLLNRPNQFEIEFSYSVLTIT